MSQRIFRQSITFPERIRVILSRIATCVFLWVFAERPSPAAVTRVYAPGAAALESP
jgi:hypothetical protein